ncbi:MAG: hypothetical protein KDJ33_20240 [Gammaproteobacteria bacterium]|nr:hypothetical protein [Gammaproteobacteria bacterium]
MAITTIPPAIIRRRAGAVLLVVCLSIINSPLFAAGSGLVHRLNVTLLPESGEIDVHDIVTSTQPGRLFEFILNAGLQVQSDDGTARVLGTSADGLRATWRVSLQTPTDTLKLHYRGKPMFSARRGLGDMPQGVITPQGVYLDGASAWYPLFENGFDAVHLNANLPDGWQAVSIGRREQGTARASWTTEAPYDDIYLIAGHFTRHARRHGDIDLSVWLLNDDPALAETYLKVMGGYLDHFSQLIGPYPYAKFAVVENPWQTGFGMPSFTLLGSQVMRLPFIPYTSLPHEILHNWWGNGVRVDYALGNWSEGLTAYLADHWMQEREGKGDQYRLKALQRYSNFALQGQDRPLRTFVSRHNDASQSIGYSKSLMVFHMLRERLGDAAFVAGLRRLWNEHRYTRIGFADAVRAIGGSDSATVDDMLPWIDRGGAPSLRLTDASRAADGGAWRLTLQIDQTQSEPFAFDLPLTITLTGEAFARRERVRIDAASNRFTWQFDARPLRVDIDPQFDVLRVLDVTEQPPALNRLFGGREVWVILPSDAPAPMREAWETLVAAWQTRYPGLRVVRDDAMEKLSTDADRLLLGWENRALQQARGTFDRDDQRLERQRLMIADTAYEAAQSGVVLVASSERGVTTGFIGAPAPATIGALARKLPHYGSYGRLVFDADGRNQVRDTLSATHSSLTRQFDDQPVPLRLPPRAPLEASGRD